jgi:hypothetical protein
VKEFFGHPAQNKKETPLMKRWEWSIIYTFVLLLALSACGGQGSQQAYQAFISQLRAKGATVIEVGSGGQLPLSGTGYRMKVNGEQVEVYTYGSAEDANTDAARISSDGTTITGGTVINYDWVAPPHFYKQDRLIVFYDGSNDEIIQLLQEVLGPQFAGE